MLGTLLTDAVKRNAVHDLVASLTGALAFLAYQCGPEATGEILRDLGEGVRRLAERSRSEKEAAELKQNGIKPH